MLVMLALAGCCSCDASRAGKHLIYVCWKWRILVDCSTCLLQTVPQILACTDSLSNISLHAAGRQCKNGRAMEVGLVLVLPLMLGHHAW
jgi:hypothetical protein